MSLKTALKVLFIFLVMFGLLAVFGPKKSLAQTTDPSPLPQPSCQQTIESFGPWSNWNYTDGSVRTRTRNVQYLDAVTGELCGEDSQTQTEYAYCEQENTVWGSQQPEFPGWCEGYTVTICYQGETLELDPAVLGRYENQYTEGACAPTPTPLSCGGTTHPNAGGTECVDFDRPGGGQSGGGGTTSTGQVLGASTLAATGEANSKFGILLMILGSALTLGSLYAAKKSSL